MGIIIKKNMVCEHTYYGAEQLVCPSGGVHYYYNYRYNNYYMECCNVGMWNFWVACMWLAGIFCVLSLIGAVCKAQRRNRMMAQAQQPAQTHYVALDITVIQAERKRTITHNK